MDDYQQELLVGDVPAVHAANPASAHRTAVTDGYESLTWAELERRATGMAVGLRNYGVPAGEPVAVYAGNSVRYVELIYALAKAGNPIVPLSPRLVAGEVARSLRTTAARALITDNPEAVGTAPRAGELAVALLHDGEPRAVERYADLLADPDGARLAGPAESTPFRMSFTSGTTGSPKVCVVPHRVAMQTWADMTIDLGIGATDRELLAGPLFHGLGFTAALQQLYAGGTVHVHPRFDPTLVLDSLAEHRPTVLPGVPIMFDRVLDALADRGFSVPTDSVRLVLSSGARAGAARKRRLGAAFPDAVVCEFLASTEAGMVAVNRDNPDGAKAESCGQPFFRTRVGILNEAGATLPPGEVGEIGKRGLLTGPVYLGDPARTAESFRAGWYLTGDLGYVDDDGYLYVVGRRKEVIVSGGVNIYPAEIETVIAELPGVREVAVVGVPDDTWGETVKAVVVPETSDHPAPADIEARCRAELAGYKVPRLIAYADELPRTASGKLLRRDLADPSGLRRTATGWA